ncbi:hypothetical protein VQ042_25640 [Aurantimonas sp. A2-1-M11]|uniref:hypothetical protein n=1 Tax=Aurantimonas sp. A2-1-M11 TaxID=3113712 RepID=UPI002F929B6D
MRETAVVICGFGRSNTGASTAGTKVGTASDPARSARKACRHVTNCEREIT